MNHNQFPSNPFEITHHCHYVRMRTICLFNKAIDRTENAIWGINHVFAEHRKAILYVEGIPLCPRFITARPPPPPPPPINITTSNEKELFCSVTSRSVNSFLSCFVYCFFYFILYVFIHGNEILRHGLHAAIRGVRLEVWIEGNTFNCWLFTQFCNSMISKLLQLPVSNCSLHFWTRTYIERLCSARFHRNN